MVRFGYQGALGDCAPWQSKYPGVSKLLCLVRASANPPFVSHKGKDVNSDWLADQWEERSILGHAQIHKGRMKGDNPEIDTAQTPKRFDRLLLFWRKSERLSLIVSRTMSVMQYFLL